MEVFQSVLECQPTNYNYNAYSVKLESGYLSQYRDRLWAGWPRFDSKLGKTILFSIVSRPALGPSYPMDTRVISPWG
jgi:hypothetical protein